MAKTKKEEIQEEILEQQEEQPVADPKTSEDPIAKLKAKALARVEAIQKARENMIKLYCKTDTPYLTEPNINRNVSGIIPKGTLLYATEIVDHGTNGKFYKINDHKYVNTKWDFEVF